MKSVSLTDDEQITAWEDAVVAVKQDVDSGHLEGREGMSA